MIHLLYPVMVLAGVAIGLCGCSITLPSDISLPQILLYLLVVQVGLGLGMRPDLKDIFRNFQPKLFLLPICTIVGTLSFTFLAALLFKEDGLGDTMAIGSGFGYYTLSSVLIGQFKEASVGAEAAASIAAVALLANVVREMFALISCRYLSKRGYGLAAISVAGINSMDVCLPMIIGDEKGGENAQLVPAALFHGFALEVSVPLLVAMFCC